jgi:hypothetical protein
MNKTREIMIENGQNVSWCKPLKHRTEDIFLIVNEGEISGIRINGKDENVTPEIITELAKKLNESYDEYEGWSDTHILLDADFEEMGCCDCPYFDICEAMDDDE